MLYIALNRVRRLMINCNIYKLKWSYLISIVTDASLPQVVYYMRHPLRYPQRTSAFSGTSSKVGLTFYLLCNMRRAVRRRACAHIFPPNSARVQTRTKNKIKKSKTHVYIFIYGLINFKNGILLIRFFFMLLRNGSHV